MFSAREDFWVLSRDFDRFSNELRELKGFTRFRAVLKRFGGSIRAFRTIDRLRLKHWLCSVLEKISGSFRVILTVFRTN